MNVLFSVGTTILIYVEAMLTPFIGAKILHIKLAILNGTYEATVTKIAVQSLSHFQCNTSGMTVKKKIESQNFDRLITNAYFSSRINRSCIE